MWRTKNGVVKSFLYDLAAAAKQDFVEYRRGLVAHNRRALSILNLAAEKTGCTGEAATIVRFCRIQSMSLEHFLDCPPFLNL